jgi:hypothetical protein
MVQVFDELCTETGLEWTSAESGAEMFVTLSLQCLLLCLATVRANHKYVH